MAFSLSNAISGAGGAAADLAKTSYETEVKKEAEFSLMAERDRIQGERDARLAEMQHRYRVKEADLGVEREIGKAERMTPIEQEKARGMPRTLTKGSAFYSGRPGEEPIITPDPESESSIDLKKAQAEQARAGARAWDENRRGSRVNADATALRLRQEESRNVTSATSILEKTLKEDTDEFGGKKAHDPATVSERKRLAGELVRAGKLAPEVAADVAFRAPIKSDAEIKAMAEKDYKDANLPYGSSKDDYVKGRIKEYKDFYTDELDRFKQEHGIQSRGAGSVSLESLSPEDRQRAIEILRENQDDPKQIKNFNKIFGPGAAERVLGGSDKKDDLEGADYPSAPMRAIKPAEKTVKKEAPNRDFEERAGFPSDPSKPATFDPRRMRNRGLLDSQIRQ